MVDVTDFTKCARKPGAAVCDPMTGDDLAAILARLEGAWRVASDRQSDIENAAGILEVFADSPNLVDSERAWLQVEYAARQFRRHAKDLETELEEVELVTMALRRAIEASPVPTEGGAA